MTSNRSSQSANPSDSIEAAARQWREWYKVLDDIKGSPHAGAHFLSFYRDQMVSSSDRLLELGLDVSDLHNPREVPVPIASHPKTKAEARRWEAEISLHVYQHVLSFSMAGVGAHVVHSAVEDEALVEVLMGYVSDPHARFREIIATLISGRYLEVSALACSLWLLEPTGSMTTSAGDLDAQCFNRMLYAFEINPLIRIHRQAKDNKLPEAERAAATDVAAGWSLANLRWHGKPGGELRRALGEYKRFLEELPSASLIVWKERAPSEPLRSTGKLEENLARCVAKEIVATGNEDATKLGKLVHDALGSVIEGAGRHHDELLEEFELRETAQQELGQLKVWVEKTKLTEKERRVYELDMRTDHDTPAIARELGIAESTVRVQRRNYRAKIRKVAGH